MQKAAITSRFLTGCSSQVGLADSENEVSRGDLLRHIVTKHLVQTVHSQELFVKLTNELIRFAEQAYFARNVDALDEVSQALMNLPTEPARQIGSYYFALAIYRKGQKDEANSLLEKLADESPITYRARAIQSLGAHHHTAGQLDEALRFQAEALRAASDENAHGLQSTLMARWVISIIKSQNGDHKGAWSDLKNLNPLVNLVAKHKPFYFYAYCNSIAVGLGEMGRIAEAEATLQIALASPYAAAYPNWAETREELEAKSTSATPSVVAINQTSEVIPAPQTQQLRPCPVRSQPAQIRKRVFAFCWLSSRGTFHKALITIAGLTAINHCQTTYSTLDQLGSCIRSRAPPASA